MAKFTDYFPKGQLSEAGTRFLDDFVWAIFNQTRKTDVIKTALVEPVGNGTTVRIKELPADLKVGDMIFVSNKSDSNFYDRVTAIVNGTWTNVEMKKSIDENIEVREVSSISGDVIGLNIPLNGSYAADSVVLCRINSDKRRTILLEDIASSAASGLTGGIIDSRYFLDTYVVDPTPGNTIYSIPIFTSKIFAVTPSIKNMKISYVDPNHGAWVDLVQGTDYYVEGPVEYVDTGYISPNYFNDTTYRLVILRNPTVNTPITISGTPTYRVLRIDYDIMIPSDIDMSSSSLSLFNEAGCYYRLDTTVGINDTLISIPQVSYNIMGSTEEPVRSLRLEPTTSEAFLDSYSTMTAMNDVANVIPVHRNNLVIDSKNIHSRRGSTGLVKSFARLSGAEIVVEEDYSLNLVPGQKMYETFTTNQMFAPSYEFIRILHKFRNDSSPLNSIAPAGFGNAGAVSYGTHSGTYDVSFTTRTVSSLQVGLTDTFVDYTTANIDLAVQLNSDSTIDLYRGGMAYATNVGSYAVDSIITIRMTPTAMSVLIDGVDSGTSVPIVTDVERYVIASIDATSCITTDYSVLVSTTLTDVYWNQTLGVEQGDSILQTYLEAFIPPGLVTGISGVITDPGYAGNAGYGTTSYGAVIEYNPSSLMWSNIELQLVYMYMRDFIPNLNEFVHDTIHDAMRLFSTYKDHDILVLSDFSITAAVNSNSIFQGSTEARIADMVDVIKPFSRYFNRTSYVETIV